MRQLPIFTLFIIQMTDMRLNIFDFNHIDTTLSKDTVDMLKNLYAYYHKKHYGFEKLYRSYQRKNLLCNIVVGKAVIASAVAGGITLNPAVFASLTALPLALWSRLLPPLRNTTKHRVGQRRKNRVQENSRRDTVLSPW